MWSLTATKVASMIVLGVTSFVLGVLPLRLAPSRRGRRSGAGPECPRHAAAAGPVLTGLLAFGAGALLATAVVHMLPEAAEQLPRVAPIALLVGFLALYLVDELVQRLMGHSPVAAHTHQAQPHPACPVDEPCGPGDGDLAASSTKHADYGAVQTSTTFCSSMKRPSLGVEAVALLHDAERPGPGRSRGRVAGGASCWGLLLALSIHSVIEGLAVGLEETPEQVAFLLGAVSSHKLVVSFCLGAELVGGSVGLGPHLLAVGVFAAGSSAGVGLGMGLFGGPDVGDWPLLPTLQALAAGTLLYVTLAEVLPRERARYQHNFPRRLLQFAAFGAGVVIITALVYALDNHDHTAGPVSPG